VVQAENFTNLAHGQSLGWHLDPLRWLAKDPSYLVEDCQWCTSPSTTDHDPWK
jgi:hypothetical protein